jgi:uncharacterized surface protein with fasciclin (FAS1) repeats
MRNKLVLKLLAVVFGLALIGAACSDDSEDTSASGDTTESEATTEDSAEEPTTTMAEEPTENIVEIAAGNEDFSTLVELVTAAGLGETLAGPGPFTVFAPTNEAFEAVDAATLESLAADPTGALAGVLQLHVISGEVLAEDAVAAAGTCVDTLGGKVKVEQVGDDLTIGGAKIVTTDIMATNGVIHVIDGVITAPSTDC